MSERRDIFVSQLLKLSHVLVVLQLAWVPTSPKLSCIMRSGLAPFLGCQGSCGIAPNEPVDSVQPTSGLEVLACSFYTDFNYLITMFQLHPSLNHWVKFSVKMDFKISFPAVFSNKDSDSSSTLTWTQETQMNILTKCINFQDI